MLAVADMSLSDDKGATCSSTSCCWRWLYLRGEFEHKLSETSPSPSNVAQVAQDRVGADQCSYAGCSATACKHRGAPADRMAPKIAPTVSTLASATSALPRSLPNAVRPAFSSQA